MPRWHTITTDSLKAAGHGTLIDSARTRAVGGADPVDEAIANAVARVRRAVAPGNVLDADATKVPGSLKGVAEKLAIYDLMERIGMDGSYWKDARKEITSDLNRSADNKTKVEMPDDAEGEASVGETGIKITSVNVPVRLTGRDRTSGL
jgi:hypothetical protein